MRRSDSKRSALLLDLSVNRGSGLGDHRRIAGALAEQHYAVVMTGDDDCVPISTADSSRVVFGVLPGKEIFAIRLGPDFVELAAERVRAVTAGLRVYSSVLDRHVLSGVDCLPVAPGGIRDRRRRGCAPEATVVRKLRRLTG